MLAQVENHPDLRESGLSVGCEQEMAGRKADRRGMSKVMREQKQRPEKASRPCRCGETAKLHGRRRDTPLSPCGVTPKQTFPK